ncbi:kunitz-type trypsin inhibitor-like 1 protein [Vicia villosa]|uniref:kunitz-type trypsin inhibitor-like 1 protein n=1 Tax=Vicia villosa TaxID=3911 RepID=UPI00273CA626|nr:kunitz-type trypsin inhibitor-like 1 protein [Vicia villosa]
MKPVLSLIFSIFLFVLIAIVSLSFSNNHVKQVLDINGNPISPSEKYYILPAIHEPYGGGVRLGKIHESECEVSIFQDSNKLINGLPVKFNVSGLNPDIIFTGTPIEIEFTERPNCAESPKWLIYVDDIILKACVGIGGPENYPSFKTWSGTFNIKKHESGFGYKLGFCKKDSSSCLDIGRYNNNEDQDGSRLILTHQVAYAVVFVDADLYEAGIVKSVA